MKAPSSDDLALIEGLKNHDNDIVDEFVNRYSRPLFGVILNYLKDPSDAEEVLQETLLKVVRKIDTFRSESHLWPWITRIAINNCIMWLRKHKSSREKEVQMEEKLSQFQKEGQQHGMLCDWPIDPEKVTLNSELAKRLRDAVQSLPAEYRAPLVLRDIEGYSIKEISNILELKEATTKTRIHRSRLFVRERLTKYIER